MLEQPARDLPLTAQSPGLITFFIGQEFALKVGGAVPFNIKGERGERIYPQQVEVENNSHLVRAVRFNRNHLGMMILSFGDSQMDLDITLKFNLTLALRTLNAET